MSEQRPIKINHLEHTAPKIAGGGLNGYDQSRQVALLGNFKNRLLTDIRCESYEPWKREHIADCAVFSVETWNKKFPNWQIARLSAAMTTGA